MILKNSFLRETGHKEYNFSHNLDCVLQDLVCFKHDEHYIEGEESGLIPPLAVGFHKENSDILGLVEEEGGIIIYDTSKFQIHALKQDWLAHKNAIFDLDWMPGENKLLTASGDQSVQLWDVATETSIAIFRGHTSSCKTVRFLDNNKHIFASGARDGCVMLWDARVQPKVNQGESWRAPVNVLNNGHALPSNLTPKSAQKRRALPSGPGEGPQQSVTAVIFQDEHTLITASSVDGNIKMWDTRKTYTTSRQPLCKHQFPYSGESARTHGFASLILDSTKTRLFASCMDHVIYQYDCAALTKQPVNTFRGHQMGTFYIKLAMSPDDNFLLSGSSDNNAYMWNVNTPSAPPITLTGHMGEVSDVAWSPQDWSRVVTSSDDGTLRIWRILRNREEAEKLSNLQPGLIVGKATRKEQPKARYNTRACMRGRHLPQFVVKNVVENSPTVYAAKSLLSPIKGTMLPASPAKISPAVRRSLAQMIGTTQPSSPLKSPIKTPFKTYTSPRKLSLTPVKSPDGCLSGVKALQDSPSKQEANLERAAGIKRKLCDISPDISDNEIVKRPCPNSVARKSLFSRRPSGTSAMDVNTNVISFKSIGDNQDCKNNEVDPSTNGCGFNNNKQETQTLNSDSAVYKHCTSQILSKQKSPLKSVHTPKKDTLLSPNRSSPRRSSPRKQMTPFVLRTSPRKSYRSPTVNLPNYVFDPQPRTPVGKLPEVTGPRTPDWLTQIAANKSRVAADENNPTHSPRTPKGARRQIQTRTPHSGRRTPVSGISSPQTPQGSPGHTPSRNIHTPSSRTPRTTPSSRTPRGKTPRGSKKNTPTGSSKQTPLTLKRKGSILQYFSPNAEKK